MLKQQPYDELCSLMRFMHIFSGKWTLPILYQLTINDKELRYGELLKKLRPIPSKELSKNLKVLEKHKLISKKVFAEIPPRVEYHITDLGKTLKVPIEQLSIWMSNYKGAL